MAWTKEQESAINARGCSVLVSAAAGSGKTSVLVERLVRILSDSENRVPADRMIVVTFTKDAAAEMKQRLTRALSELIENEPENQWLNEQQLLLQSAKISTIHSFCFELIRDNIQELELSGSFRIMDETEYKLMLTGIISETVTDFWKTNPDMMNCLYDQFCSKDDSPIEEITKEIYDFICSLPYGISWLERVCDSYSPSGNACSEFLGRYTGYIQSDARRALELSDECVRIVPDGNYSEKAFDIVNTENDCIRKTAEYFSSSASPEEKAEKFALPAFATLSPGKNADPDIKARITLLRDEYKKLLKEKISNKIKIILHAKEDTQAHYRVLSAFLELIRETDSRLWRRKVEKGCIGFSDAEMLAVKLLSVQNEDGTVVKSQLAQELSEYYQIIMIDEFQDTNNNQDLIFRMLSRGGTAERPGNNLFMVGDVKQSIYRFRLANPKNFISTMDCSVEYTDENSGENSFIRLNRNFRSSSDVINLVNFVFSTVMSREVGEIVYDSGEELVQGASFSEADRTTEVAVIDEDAENAVTQAQYTAEKIASMLRDGVTVDEKNGKTRPCCKKDFCILLRKKNDAAGYIRELAARGINAYSEETGGYLSSREISLLISLLRVTDNPLIDTSMAAVMLSPLFMFTDDEMIMLRLLNRKAHLYNVISEITDSEHDEEISQSVKDKALKLKNTVGELRMLAASKSLTELIQHIYDRLDFISFVQLYDDGDRKRANLRALLEYAKIYQQSSDDGLNGFVRYIDRTLKMNGDFKQGQTVSTSEDVVVIKTIHKSKGLEFPFVFLCETQSLFNRSDSLKKYQFNFEKGIGFRLQERREFKTFTTLPYEVINGINHSDSVSEEMRLLYVALTRAREKLFIPLSVGKKQKKKLADIAPSVYHSKGITPAVSRTAGSMADWLLMAFMTHRDGKILREMSGYDQFVTQDADFKILFTEVNAELSEQNEDETVPENILPDSELTEKIIRNFDKCADSKAPSVQAKFAVSDITKDHSRFGLVLKRPSFMKEQKGMTAAERGTAVHSILQHADFKLLEENPEKEILRAAENGFITKKQAEELDASYLRAFTDSEIFRRAAASSRTERERKFLVRISDLNTDEEEFSRYAGTDSMVQGIIDMYFEEDGGLVLVDYKTDNVSDMSVLVENYSLQLSLYSAALEKIENKKVKQRIIYSLKLGKYAEV